MEQENISKCEPCCSHSKYFIKKSCSSSTPVYCLGVIGAAVYYISHAETFWVGVVGMLKAFVWPAFVVHGLMGLLFGV